MIMSKDDARAAGEMQIVPPPFRISLPETVASARMPSCGRAFEGLRPLYCCRHRRDRHCYPVLSARLVLEVFSIVLQFFFGFPLVCVLGDGSVPSAA